MGSWFSSPRDGYISVPAGLIARIAQLKEEIRAVHDYECANRASDDAYCIRDLAYDSLYHYNSNHLSANFRFPAQPSTPDFGITTKYPPTVDMKGACVGFRKDLWYHLNFSACRRTDDGHDDERTFFAELCYDNTSHDLIVKTCIILEKPSRSSSTCCTLCPDESNILHPDDAEFVCGKEGHEREFFSHRCAPDGTEEFFSRRDMLRLPFLLGGPTPRYRLVVDSP